MTELSEFYLIVDEDNETLDLTNKDDTFEELIISGRRGITIVNDYIPSSIKFLCLNGSNIRFLNLENCSLLEEILISDNPGLTIKDDYFPISLQYLQANNESLVNFKLERNVSLQEIQVENNQQATFSTSLPFGLEIFIGTNVSFESLDFYHCPNLCFLRLKSTRSMLLNMSSPLKYVSIHDTELKQDSISNLVLLCQESKLEPLHKVIDKQINVITEIRKREQEFLQ